MVTTVTRLRHHFTLSKHHHHYYYYNHIFFRNHPPPSSSSSHLPKSHFSSSPSPPTSRIRPTITGFLNGWRSRVAADPKFPFKVAMEQLVGVSACVIGDMSSRPNFGLDELDLVFSTLVVSSILNFTLMYILAPTLSPPQTQTTLTPLSSIFATCPKSHMFESGPYTLLNRFGTFVYKGVLFAAVGFAAGIVGTAISNWLMRMRKSEEEAPPLPMVLNAATWAVQMGVSSNLRYQSLNGIEFFLARLVSPGVFNAAVVVLRCLNNVLGGVSFVALARLTGSQKKVVVADGGGESAAAEEREKKLI